MKYIFKLFKIYLASLFDNQGLRENFFKIKEFNIITIKKVYFEKNILILKLFFENHYIF